MNPYQSVEKTTFSIFDIVFTFDFNESNLLSFRTNVVCPTGYFLQGLYRNSGEGWVHHIEEAKCCKPNTFPDKYEDCYGEDIWGPFDNIGLSGCKKRGYYVAGIYKGGCDNLGCIERLFCCKMSIGKLQFS